jgi:hypothetical protein
MNTYEHLATVVCNLPPPWPHGTTLHHTTSAPHHICTTPHHTTQHHISSARRALRGSPNTHANIGRTMTMTSHACNPNPIPRFAMHCIEYYNRRHSGGWASGSADGTPAWEGMSLAFSAILLLIVCSSQNNSAISVRVPPATQLATASSVGSLEGRSDPPPSRLIAQWAHASRRRWKT